MAYRNLKKENCFDDKFKIHLDDWLKTVPDQQGVEATPRE